MNMHIFKEEKYEGKVTYLKRKLASLKWMPERVIEEVELRPCSSATETSAKSSLRMTIMLSLLAIVRLHHFVLMLIATKVIWSSSELRRWAPKIDLVGESIVVIEFCSNWPQFSSNWGGILPSKHQRSKCAPYVCKLGHQKMFQVKNWLNIWTGLIVFTKI